MTLLEQKTCEAIIKMAKKDDPDYWTRLEHQAAIGAMQGILSNPSITESNLTTRRGVIEDAERLAHALVEKMKENEKAMH